MIIALVLRSLLAVSTTVLLTLVVRSRLLDSPDVAWTLMLANVVAMAFVGGLIPGLIAVMTTLGCFAQFMHFNSRPVFDPLGVPSILLLTGLGFFIGFLSQDRKHLRQSLDSLRSTVQRLVDERVMESAATNKELSLEFSERLKIEETLHLREVAMEALPHGVVITDAKRGNIIMYANQEFYRLSGYTPAEVVGRNCRFLQGTDTSQVALTELRSAIREKRSCLVELQNYRKDGTTFWNALTVAPIFNEQGELTHFVGVQIDISNFKKVEEQFRQSQKMEAVGHLASGIAHDFNNLLTVINGCGELLLGSLDANDPNRPFLDEIVHAGERAAGLTRQLLTFSRKSTTQPMIVDPNDLVANLEKMLARLIGADIKLTLELDQTVGMVKVDPGQFEQVILNLAVNARDAMPRGGTLKITSKHLRLGETDSRLLTDQKPGEYVLLSITDTGTGMDRPTQSRLFEPFFTTKPAGKGTGLGLATVYGIIQQSGGQIEVQSELGVGTTFHVFLPAAVEEMGASRYDDGAIQHPSDPGIETILLVEDEPGVRTLAKHALTEQGYFVLTAANGIEALHIAAMYNEEIHLLLTDVVMPEMGGRDLSEYLLPRHPNMKVLFMSGYTDDAVIRNGVFSSEMHFLQKPFSMANLLTMIRKVLDTSLQETLS